VGVSVGVVGVGRWGPNLLRNFHGRTASSVRAVAERDDRRRAQIAEMYPDVEMVADAGELVGRPDLDAVVIATPTVTHFELVRASLEAGKHVMVEKPLTHDVEEALQLQALAAERDRVLLVGHVFLFNPAVEKVKEYLGGDLLGAPYYVSMVRTNLGPVRTDVNASWDLAAHDVSIANYWLDGVPVSVSATGGTWINGGIADAVFAVLEYPGGVLVNLHVSWLSPRKVRDITVVAENRMLTLDDTNPSEPIRIYDKGIVDTEVREGVVDTLGRFRSIVHEGDITIPRVSLGEPLRTECEHFVECITDGVECRSGAREGVDVVRTLAAIDRSIAAGGARTEVR